VGIDAFVKNKQQKINDASSLLVTFNEMKVILLKGFELREAAVQSHKHARREAFCGWSKQTDHARNTNLLC